MTADSLKSDPQLAAPWEAGTRVHLGALLLYFLATYAVSWSFWIPTLLVPMAARSPLRTVLWLPGVFAPALVAVWFTARNGGSAAVRALLGRILQWQARARWYLFAVGYMAAVKLTVALAHRVITGSWPRFGNEGPVIILAAILISTPVQAGEELGWRGYALPRLAERLGYARGSVLLGVIWAGWHLPQFFLPAADTYGQSFPIWALEVTALSVAIAWLYLHTHGSLLLPMLMHAAVNNSKDIVPSASANATNAFSLHASPVLYLTVIVLWITAAYFLVRMPKAEAPRSMEKSARSGL
jgi:membrane protease YdiL (CAAX protease family)